MDELSRTDRTTLRRLPNRGVYDRASIHSILDEGLICHVGFVVDGQPYVIPTIHVRVGEKLFFHGSPASRMLRALEQGVEVCVTVTGFTQPKNAPRAFSVRFTYDRLCLVCGAINYCATLVCAVDWRL